MIPTEKSPMRKQLQLGRFLYKQERKISIFLKSPLIPFSSCHFYSKQHDTKKGRAYTMSILLMLSTNIIHFMLMLPLLASSFASKFALSRNSHGFKTILSYRTLAECGGVHEKYKFTGSLSNLKIN